MAAISKQEAGSRKQEAGSSNQESGRMKCHARETCPGEMTTTTGMTTALRI